MSEGIEGVELARSGNSRVVAFVPPASVPALAQVGLFFLCWDSM